MVEFAADIPTLSGMLLGLQGALRVALRSIAEQHGNKPGQWLDDLEAEAIRDTKGAHSTAMPLEAENAIVRIGIEAIKAVFALTRNELADLKNK